MGGVAHRQGVSSAHHMHPRLELCLESCHQSICRQPCQSPPGVLRSAFRHVQPAKTARPTGSDATTCQYYWLAGEFVALTSAKMHAETYMTQTAAKVVQACED